VTSATTPGPGALTGGGDVLTVPHPENRAPVQSTGRGRGAGRLVMGSVIALLLAFLAVPMVSLFFYADPVTLVRKLGGPLAGQALGLSLGTTAASLVLAVATGTPLAYWLAKHSFPGKRAIELGLQLTIVLPASVAGLGLLLVFGRSGLFGAALSYGGIQVPFTALAVILAQAYTAVALYVSSARLGFEAVDDELIAASRTLGVPMSRTFLRVVLPLAGPAVLTGMALGWARALGEFGATLVFAGNLPGTTQTLPLAIYVALESDLTTAVAVAVLLLGVAVVPLVGVQYAGYRLTRGRRRHLVTTTPGVVQ
jgi:molybdate transport system permease protein